MYFPDLTFLWVGAILLAGALQLLAGTTDWIWHVRRVVGGMSVALYMMSLMFLVATKFAFVVCVLIGAGTLYLIINSARLAASRFHPNYLRDSVPFNVWLLYGYLLVVITGGELIELLPLRVTPLGLLITLLIFSIGIGLVLSWRLWWASAHYRVGHITPITKEKQLPTVTLAVTARNETHALSDMLTLALKSDYPKLEILVLDDCSQDATAQVIRSFAHDGVRFIQGEVPADGWLGKNYACETLAREASGDIIIFAGVDTHFEVQSVSHLVSYMIQQKAEMASVLPYRREVDFLPAFFDQLGNFWQVLWPITARHVPISSPCWAIWSDTLRRIGGFGAYKKSIFPEAHFAQVLKQKRSYRFMVSDTLLGICTRKKLSSQFATATRTFYPILKRRPAMVLAASVSIMLLLLLPYGVLGWQLVQGSFSTATAFAGIAVVVFGIVNMGVTLHVTPKAWWLGFFNFPIAATLQMLLFNWSMLQFEFGEVNWKGRNVCYPILEAIPMGSFTAQLSKPRQPTRR